MPNDDRKALAMYEIEQAILATRRLNGMIADIQALYGVEGHEGLLRMLIAGAAKYDAPNVEDILHKFCNKIWEF